MNQNTKGKLAIILAAFVWSFGFWWVRIFDSWGYTPPTFIFINFAFSLVFLFFILKAKKIRLMPEKSSLKWLILMGFADVTTALTLIWAFVLTKVAMAELLHFTMPVWIFLIAAFWLKEKITRWKFLALILSLIGILLVFDLSIVTSGLNLANLGNLLALVSAVGFAFVVVIGRKLNTLPPYLTVFWNRIIGTAVVFFFFLFDNTFQSWYHLPIFIIYAFATSIIPLSLVFYGLKKTEASTSSILALLEAPLAIVWAWLFFSESLTLLNIIGGILILLSSALIIKKQKK